MDYEEKWNETCLKFCILKPEIDKKNNLCQLSDT